VSTVSKRYLVPVDLRALKTTSNGYWGTFELFWSIKCGPESG
jgi:hypothetical protein